MAAFMCCLWLDVGPCYKSDIAKRPERRANDTMEMLCTDTRIKLKDDKKRMQIKVGNFLLLRQVTWICEWLNETNSALCRSCLIASMTIRQKSLRRFPNPSQMLYFPRNSSINQAYQKDASSPLDPLLALLITSSSRFIFFISRPKARQWNGKKKGSMKEENALVEIETWDEVFTCAIISNESREWVSF